MPGPDRPCPFCALLADPANGHFVYQDDLIAVFLDRSPVFPGHCLVIPRAHHETLADLPPELLTPLYVVTQRLAAVMPEALEADGTLIVTNNRVSQSVPHLHVHVIPRRRGDGLRHFLWPRQRYASAEQAAALATRLREALQDSSD